MQKPRFVETATLAIALLLLSLLASSCSTPNGSGSSLTPWPTPTPISAAQPNSNGAMARANVHGTGVYVTAGVRQLAGLSWKFTAGASGSITIPAIQGSTVYFGHDGRAYAVDAGTGTERWNRRLDNTSTSAPAIVGDTMYIGAWEEFYALSTATGGVKWSFQPPSGSDDGYYIDPVIEGGIVYFGAWHSIYALDGETGQAKWTHKLSAVIRSVPSVYDGTLYIGTFSPDKREVPYLYALDSQTGQEKWKFKASDGGVEGAVAVTDGMVYVSTSDDGLLALDATNGQEKWRYHPNSGLTRAPAVAYGMVYITNRGFLAAIDAQTGQEKWRLPISDSFPSDPVIADGILYFGTTTDNLAALFVEMPLGELHAVDAHSGQELWKFSVAGTGSTEPTIADGTVYFGDSKGTLYAIK